MIMRVFFSLVSVVLGFLGEGAASLATSLCNLCFSITEFLLVRVIHSIWNTIGNLIMLWTSREDEYGADMFSYELGYGSGLLTFLSTMPDAASNGKGKWKLLVSKLATIGETHPATWSRIERLKAAGTSVEMKIISDSAVEDFTEISENG